MSSETCTVTSDAQSIVYSRQNSERKRSIAKLAGCCALFSFAGAILSHTTLPSRKWSLVGDALSVSIGGATLFALFPNPVELEALQLTVSNEVEVIQHEAREPSFITIHASLSGGSSTDIKGRVARARDSLGALRPATNRGMTSEVWYVKDLRCRSVTLRYKDESITLLVPELIFGCKISINGELGDQLSVRPSFTLPRLYSDTGKLET